MEGRVCLTALPFSIVLRIAMPRQSPTLLTRLEKNLGERAALAIFLVPALIVLAAAQFYPLAYSAVISLYDWSLARSPDPGPFAGLTNYRRALSDRVFIGSVAFTVVFALATTALQIVFGLALAMLTVSETFALRFTRVFLILPMVVAPVAARTMWRMILSARVGPLNKGPAALGIEGPNWLGDPGWAVVSLILIDAWEWAPYAVIIFTAALVSLPREVLLAASVDGTSHWQTFRLVVFPMLVPVIVLVAMFRLIDGLLTLDVVFTTTGGGPGFTTHTLSFWIYQQGLRYFNISYAAATSWLLLIGCTLVAAGFLMWRRRVMHWQTGAAARQSPFCPVGSPLRWRCSSRWRPSRCSFSTASGRRTSSSRKTRGLSRAIQPSNTIAPSSIPVPIRSAISGTPLSSQPSRRFLPSP
jgi:ABC-type sugar transport system permease subunit